MKECEIIVAPFDVRQSGFTGEPIKAVTKSGTNEWESAGYYYRNEDFVHRPRGPAGAGSSPLP